ncbi:hypothetical protein [Catenulispora rubra]|uniref:hypothetical protein n=1 Tax=Catenulispora rubra TaxID=280293 RepID=UPI00189225DE|nr:hypothetical protein [Catenulispora rubra]
MALSTASCASTHPAAEPPATGPIPTITSPDQVTRPIFSYTVSADQATTIFSAIRVGTEACMRDFGFTLELPKPPDEKRDVYQNLARTKEYGFFDPASDPAKGYDTKVHQEVDTALLNRMPADERSVLDGVDAAGKPTATFGGKPVPSGGCAGAGVTAVGGKIPIVQDSGALPDQGPAVPATDPRVAEVNKKWSACMAQKGFHYATPWDAYINPRWSQLTPAGNDVVIPHEEVATASADLACKREFNLVGVVVAVEGGYDRQYIGSHKAALNEYDKTVAQQVQQASAFIASHPGLP